MKFELSYEDIADICLKADGGYCHSCASDVAKGFSEKIENFNLERLENIIDKKMEEHYNK